MSIEEKIRTSSKKPLALELSPQQAAEVLGVHPRTIRNMIANKQLEAIKVNRKWYIKSQSVARVREVDSKIVEPKHKKYEKGPKNLAAFRLCLHAFDSFDLSLNGEEIDMRIKARQLDVIENLGSGYYSYGGEKLRYYRRARASLGAIIGLLSSTRCASSDVAKAIVFLELECNSAIGNLLRKFESQGSNRKAKSNATTNSLH